MLRYITAGESHGEGLVVIVEGLPYGTPFDKKFIDRYLARRQGGYGRSQRMQIEKDEVQVISGVRGGKAIGSPITFLIKNREAKGELTPITRPRPGHVDMPSAFKFDLDDVRDIVERASARETVARVAAGGLANYVLSKFGISVIGFVCQIGEVAIKKVDYIASKILKERDRSIFYFYDSRLDQDAKDYVDWIKARGSTIGGVFEVAVFGVPPGLGGCFSWEHRLDANIARAVMAIPSVKGVEIGTGFGAATLSGVAFFAPLKLKRFGVFCDHDGGICGGLTNGNVVLIRAFVKPVPTIKDAQESINLKTGKKAPAHYERADICVVPAVSVVGEAVIGFEILKAFLQKFGADTFSQTRQRFFEYKKRIKRFI
jgi:chorismate synthase